MFKRLAFVFGGGAVLLWLMLWGLARLFVGRGT